MPSSPPLGLDALAILNESPAITYVVDVTGEPVIVFVSDAVATVLGYPAERFSEQPGFLTSIIHADDRASVARQTAFAARALSAYFAFIPMALWAGVRDW